MYLEPKGHYLAEGDGMAIYAGKLCRKVPIHNEIGLQYLRIEPVT